jgi:hypothetical protein
VNYRRAGSWAVVLIVVLVVGCGGETSQNGDIPPVEGGGLVTPMFPPHCPGTQRGVGAVWLDNPSDMSLVELPLHCMSGSGQLQGSFVSSVQPEGSSAASSSDLRFVYSLDDPRLQEVQVYHALTGMAGHFQSALSSDPKAIRVQLSANASFTTSRYDWPDRLRIAAGGVVPKKMVPLQVLLHEYGHHLILRHGQIDQVLNEGMADYLAADFTGNPRILDLERLDLPDSVRDDPEALAIARRYLERRVDNQLSYPADVVTQKELCQTLNEAAGVFPASSALVPAQKLQRCKSMSKQELAAPEPHRTGMIIAGTLWDLRRRLGSAVVNTLLFEVLRQAKNLSVENLYARLQSADQSLNGHQNMAAIQEVCKARGLP